MPRKRKSGAGIGRRRRRRPKIRSYPSIHSKRPSGRKIKSASRIVKRKSVPQQDDNSAPPFKKMKTDRQFLPFEEAKRVVLTNETGAFFTYACPFLRMPLIHVPMKSHIRR